MAMSVDYKPDLIGYPDPKVLAEDMALDGHYSCADAEAKGWFVTEDMVTRNAVDEILGKMIREY